MRFLVFAVVSVACVITGHAAKMIEVWREATRDKSSEVTFGSLALSIGLGPLVGFKPTNGDIVRSAKGVNRQRLTETFGGLEVAGAVLVVETDLSGRLTGHLYGNVATHLEEDIPDPDACQWPIDEMLKIAILAEKRRVDDPNIDQRDGRRLVWVDPDTHAATLAYYDEFFYGSTGDFSRPAYYINACDKSVILHYEQVKNMTDSLGQALRQAPEQARRQARRLAPRQVEDAECKRCDPSVVGVGGNTKIGRTVYNVPGLCIPAWKYEHTDVCAMIGRYGRVVDNMQSTDRTKDWTLTFFCSQGYHDPINGAYGVASDAMYFANISGSLYETRYGFRALPYVPRILIHFDECYENAFWDGTDMYFGDGCGRLFPLVSLDIVTHELAHGITRRHSNLLYRDQSGGINEAFSDISGEVSEVFSRGSNDWRHAIEIVKGYGPGRDFKKPTVDGRSIMHIRDYRSGIDVHYKQ